MLLRRRLSIDVCSSRFEDEANCSSNGVSLPVSIHHPSSTCWRWDALTISHWMASAISSSPRGGRAIARTASWISA